MVDRINYELFLKEFNDFIENIPNDNDVVLFDAVDLKGRFIELFGDEN